MRYLIAYTDPELGKIVSSFTEWFEPENNFNGDVGMIVFDLAKFVFTTDGKTWHEIKEDHL
jgi:hypothetical protein